MPIGLFNKATTYTPEQRFAQNALEDVVSGKGVPFGVPITIFHIYTLKLTRNRHLGTDFDWA